MEISNFTEKKQEDHHSNKIKQGGKFHYHGSWRMIFGMILFALDDPISNELVDCVPQSLDDQG